LVVKCHGLTEQQPPPKDSKSAITDNSRGLGQPASRCAEVAKRHVVAQAEVHRGKEGVLVVPVALKHPEGALLEPDRGHWIM